MKHILLAALLLITFAIPAHAVIYRLGVPSGYTSPTTDKLIATLRTSVLTFDEELSVVPIDLDNAETEAEKKRIRKEIAEKCDLFFVTGNDLATVFTVGVTSPVLFIGTRNVKHEIPAGMKSNTTGFYWGPTATIFKRSIDFLPPELRLRLGLIYFQGSRLEQKQSFYSNTCRDLGFELKCKKYSDKSDIKRVMQEFKQSGIQALILFPPALQEGDLPELIHWQNQLGLPIISQTWKSIEAGTLGGPVIDYNVLLPKLADYADKILHKRSPGKLPIQFVSRKYMINLATVSRLGIALPQEIVDQAEIVGLANEEKKSKKITTDMAPLVEGDFVIGIPQQIRIPILKQISTYLSERGYRVGQNLHFNHIDLTGSNDPKQRQKIIAQIDNTTDLFLATGNVLPDLTALKGLKKPVCFIATLESANHLTTQQDNFTGIIRGSVESNIKGALKIAGGGKRVGLLAHKKSNLRPLFKIYRQTSSLFDISFRLYEFSDPTEIETVMRKIKTENDCVLLFPPSVTQPDLAKIIHWQNTLRLPVVAQLLYQIRAGLLGGLITDEKRVLSKLAEHIDKLLQGRAPSSLPTFYYQGKYVINLKAARTLQVKIPDEITVQAEILY